MIRIAISVIAAIITTSMTPALAEKLHCTTTFGYRICHDGHGHFCVEWERDDDLIIRDLTARPPSDPDCPTTPQEDR
jgi:hypothetical protein